MARVKILCLDLETTDLYENGGKIVELAAALCHENGDEFTRFQTYMRMEPGEQMSQGAFDKHKLTVPFLSESGVSREGAKVAFCKWLYANGVNFESSWQVQFLGQNVQFDLKFFWDWWGDAPRDWAHYTALDTMLLAELTNRVVVTAFGPDTEPFVKRNKNGNIVPSASLEAQANYFKLDYSGAHGSMFDVELTIECFKRMIKTMAEGIKK